MINMIHAENKRLWKSKGFWISSVVFVLVYVLSIFMQVYAQNAGMFHTTNAPLEPGFYISVDVVVKSLNMFAVMFGHSFGSLILGIYLSIFVCNEYSSGYIKNIIPLSHGRTAIIISKIVVAEVLAFVILLLSYGVALLLGAFLIEGFEIESFETILPSCFMMFMMTVALFSLVIMITTLFRSKVAGILLVLLIPSGMLQPFFSLLLDMLHISFLSDYTLSSLFLNTALIETNEQITVFLVTIVYTLLYNMISIFIMQKRDI